MDLQKCYQCGAGMMVIKDKPYQYSECGLDNVVIHGITQHHCQSCDETFVSIPNIEMLHRVIGKIICCQKTQLSGKEVRYLRKELHQTAKNFAAILDISPEYMSRIENGSKQVSQTLDKFIRSLYMLYASEHEKEVLQQDTLGIFSEVAKEVVQDHTNIILNPPDWMGSQSPRFCLT